MKVCEATLLKCIAMFEIGATVQEVADAIGTSTRTLYRFREKSYRHSPLMHVIHPKKGPGYFWNFVVEARQEHAYEVEPDLIGLSRDELWSLFGRTDVFKRDANGERIPRVEEPEEEPDLDDIEALREQARLEAERPKNKPNAPVFIGRVNSNDPPERRTGAPPEVSTAERERMNRRAYVSGNADLKPLAPVWAKPAPALDVATRGRGEDGMPDPQGRFTVATKTLSIAERRAGTVEFTGTGVRRW